MTRLTCKSLYFLTLCTSTIFSQNDSIYDGIQISNKNDHNWVYKKQLTEEIIVSCLDSVYKWEQDAEIPRYFFNKNIDLEYSGLWRTKNEAFSLRKQIVDGINSIEFLDFIIQNFETELSVKPDKLDYWDLPFEDFSWLDLLFIQKEKLIQDRNFRDR